MSSHRHSDKPLTRAPRVAKKIDHEIVGDPNTPFLTPIAVPFPRRYPSEMKDSTMEDDAAENTFCAVCCSPPNPPLNFECITPQGIGMYTDKDLCLECAITLWRLFKEMYPADWRERVWNLLECHPETHAVMDEAAIGERPYIWVGLKNTVEEREAALIDEIETRLPAFAETCKTAGVDQVIMTQAAFAAAYQADEYALLGKAMKYAGLRGKTVLMIPHEHDTAARQ